MLLIATCSGSAICGDAITAQPALGILKSDHGHGWKLYAIGPQFHSGDKLSILSVDKTKKVTCCAIVEGEPLPSNPDDNFLSDASEGAHQATQVVYKVAVSESALPTKNGVAIAINSRNPMLDGSQYRIVDSSGNQFLAESCIGSEGINVYLYRQSSTKPLEHYYGSFGYDVEGSDCPK